MHLVTYVLTKDIHSATCVNLLQIASTGTCLTHAWHVNVPALML